MGVDSVACELCEHDPPAVAQEQLIPLRLAAALLSEAKKGGRESVHVFGRSPLTSVRLRELALLSREMGFRRFQATIELSGRKVPQARWTELAASGVTHAVLLAPAYARAMGTAARDLRRVGVKVSVNFVIHSSNFRELPRFFARCLIDWGIRDIRVVFPHSHGGRGFYGFRYGDAAARIQEAACVYDRVGWLEGTPRILNLPPCLLPGLDLWLDNRPRPRASGDQARSESCAKVESCARCALDSGCRGFEGAYAARYGTGEFNPVSASAPRVYQPEARRLTMRGVLPPRKFHAYCVGLPRTGTTSLAGLFFHYRTLHEFENGQMLGWAEGLQAGRISRENAAALLRKRDARARLEMDSSCFHAPFADLLAAEFSEAKFILTIRDCYSWANSYMSMMLHEQPSDAELKRRFCRAYLGLDYAHFRDRRSFAAGLERSLLDPILQVWETTNRFLLRALPRDRTLLVKTREIPGRTDELAAFLGAPTETLFKRLAHGNSQDRSEDMLARVDPRLLRDKVRERCGELMADYFPDVLLSIESRARS